MAVCRRPWSATVHLIMPNMTLSFSLFLILLLTVAHTTARVVELTPDDLASAEAWARITGANDDEDRRRLMLVLVEDPHCAASSLMLERLYAAEEILAAEFDQASGSRPVLGHLAVAPTHAILHEYDIETLPSLLFFTTTTDLEPELLVLIYTGRQETAADLAATAVHYYYRLVAAAGALQTVDHVVEMTPPVFVNRAAVEAFLHEHGPHLLGRALVPALPPEYTAEQQDYLQQLLAEESLEEQTVAQAASGDDFVLLMQCRRGTNNVLYNALNQFALSISNRRDVLAAAVTECDVDGAVNVVLIPHAGPQWARLHETRLVEASPERLTERLLSVVTPSILFFDRQSTAPIAFSLDRTFHAVLVVDLHHVESLPIMRSAVVEFRRLCRRYRRQFSNLVCLVVPSTETRVLTTFGIDIWAEMDRHIRQPAPDASLPVVLPVLMVTDQRRGLGLERYYLGPEHIHGMSDFIDQVYDHRLDPELRSDPRGPRTNKSGVRIVTATSLRNELATSTHKLLVFTSSTCGHCKRFLVLWNRLQEFLTHIGWKSIDLLRLNVAENDLVGWNVTVRWVPDVYYIAPGGDKWQRYAVRDELGDEAGGLEGIVPMLDWFLNVSDYAPDDASLERLLASLDGL